MPSAKLRTFVTAALLAFAITAIGQGVWGGLVILNLARSPGVPWAPVVMAGVLVLLFAVLRGWTPPKANAEARRRLLPLKPVAPRLWAWSLLAGISGIGALTGLWIVLMQLLPAAPNVLTDASRYPRTTMAAILLMAIVAAPLTEEAAFRGYAQGLLMRAFPPVTALILSSALFALAHLTQGLYPGKLLVYLLAGLAFGFTAWRTGSLAPGMAVHSFADLVFFTLVWPNDAHRRLVVAQGADAWFWIHAAQVVVLGALSLWAYGRLAAATQPEKPAALGPAVAAA